jgi:hypothetical protein
MCLHVGPETKKKLSPALLKLLKRKSFFQIKKLDAGLKKAIGPALDAGVKYYKQKGWL